MRPKFELSFFTTYKREYRTIETHAFNREFQSPRLSFNINNLRPSLSTFTSLPDLTILTIYDCMNPHALQSIAPLSLFYKAPIFRATVLSASNLALLAACAASLHPCKLALSKRKTAQKNKRQYLDRLAPSQIILSIN